MDSTDIGHVPPPDPEYYWEFEINQKGQGPMPEITKAQCYQDLTDAIDLIRQHRKKHFSWPDDDAPWCYLGRVREHLEKRRDKVAAAIFDPPPSKWAFWRKDRNG